MGAVGNVLQQRVGRRTETGAGAGYHEAAIDRRSLMTTAWWIALGVALLFGLGYVLAMRNVYRQSRELDKKIDYRKVRPVQDTDDAD
jgi:hypothetical protein